MKVIGYTFLTIAIVFVSLLANTWVSNLQKSEIEVAEDKAEFNRATKVCRAQRDLARAIKDESFSYFQCLKQEQRI